MNRGVPAAPLSPPRAGEERRIQDELGRMDITRLLPGALQDSDGAPDVTFPTILSVAPLALAPVAGQDFLELRMELAIDPTVPLDQSYRPAIWSALGRRHVLPISFHYESIRPPTGLDPNALVRCIVRLPPGERDDVLTIGLGRIREGSAMELQARNYSSLAHAIERSAAAPAL